MPRYAEPDLRLDAATNAVGVDEYLEALNVRRTCHEMVALLGGRMPHLHGILPGRAAFPRRPRSAITPNVSAWCADLWKKNTCPSPIW